MIAGSALMVAAVLALYLISGGRTFNLDALAKTASSAPHARLACRYLHVGILS